MFSGTKPMWLKRTSSLALSRVSWKVIGPRLASLAQTLSIVVGDVLHEHAMTTATNAMRLEVANLGIGCSAAAVVDMAQQQPIADDFTYIAMGRCAVHERGETVRASTNSNSPGDVYLFHL
jgi:hypothetical protein